MADEWDQYAVKDEWAQYAASSEDNTPQDALTRLEANPMGLLTDPVKIFTGKSLGERIDKSPLPAATRRPFDSKLKQTQKAIESRPLTEFAADTATSPFTYVGGPAMKATGEVLSPLLKPLSGVINKIPQSVNRIIDSFKGASSADLEAKLAQRKVAIDIEKNKLDELFKQQAKDITFKGKQVIPQISKGMSNAYEQGLDDIFSKLDDPLQAGGILKKNAPAITNNELVGSLESLINKTANDPLIIKSDAYQKTVTMLDSFKNGIKSDSGLLDRLERPITSTPKESVDIKDLIAKVREIKATIKASTTNGSAPIAGKDYFATQFDKTVGGLLKDRVDGFRELQASYAPMANTRKVAYKIFKPLSDEDSTLSFLNRIKNNNMKASDEKLLTFLQDGGKVGDKKIPGMGNFSTDLKNIGSKLKQLKSGVEEKQLAADIFKKASDEKFRNNFFLWTLGSTGVGTGVVKGVSQLVKD